VPDPTPGEGEVVVAVEVSAICGSEMHRYRGEGQVAGNAGHEAAGTIIEIGPGVTEREVGQRVGLSGVVGCGQCEQCARGRQTWCADWKGCSGMHAERVLVPARGCHPIPDDVAWDVGVLITGDGMGVPYHTSTKIAASPVQTIAVFGVGPIGLGNVMLQAFRGRTLIAIDIRGERLAYARALGAEHVVNAELEDPVVAIRNLTGGRGPDVCIEAAGRPETLRQCFSVVRTGGTVVMNGEQGAVELSPSADFIRRDITAVGSWFYHFSEVPAILALYRQGLPVADLITHRYPLSQAQNAYAEFAAGRTGKVLLEMNE
jgi:threonine dehydrogenase-like Zn-dependent dehydrogenase